MQIKKDFGLSGNMLKILAAITMLIDHLGLMIFPKVAALRIIGRLAFPIFSYMIYEGCKYTRNKLKYFLQVFVLGVICTVVFYFVDNLVYLNVLMTFSFSIALVFLLRYFVSANDAVIKLSGLALFVISLVALYFFCNEIIVDYGFFGIILPLFPTLSDIVFKQDKEKILLLKPRFYAFAAGLSLLCAFMVTELGNLKYYAFLSLIPLSLYNGKRGFKLNKYFFYIFYPMHLVLLALIAQLI